MKIEYQRTASNSYMIVRNPDCSYENYELQMALRNHITGLLPLQVIEENGQTDYWYDITGMQSLDAITRQGAAVGRDMTVFLFRKICDVRISMEEYMLDVRDLSFDMEHIFMDRTEKKAAFCYIPGFRQKQTNGIRGLLEDILQHLNHSDQNLIRLVYRLYEKSALEDMGTDDMIRALADYQKIADETDSDSFGREKTGSDRKEAFPEYGNSFQQSGNVREEAAYPERENQNAGRSDRKEPGQSIFITERQKKQKTGKESRIREHSVLSRMLFREEEADSVPGSEIREKEYSKNKQPEREYFPPAGRKRKRKEKGTAAGYEKERWSREDLDFSKEKIRESRAVSEPVKKSSEKMEYVPESDYHTVLISEKYLNRQMHLIYQGKNGEADLVLDHFPYTIGKAQDHADGVLKSRAVSRVHARFYRDGNEYFLEDLNSMNGTFLNGEVLSCHTPVPVRSEDRVVFGNEEFLIVCRMNHDFPGK